MKTLPIYISLLIILTYSCSIQGSYSLKQPLVQQEFKLLKNGEFIETYLDWHSGIGGEIRGKYSIDEHGLLLLSYFHYEYDSISKNMRITDSIIGTHSMYYLKKKKVFNFDLINEFDSNYDTIFGINKNDIIGFIDLSNPLKKGKLKGLETDINKFKNENSWLIPLY